MDNQTITAFSHTLTYLTSAGFLGIAYYLGKIVQRINTIENWIEEHNEFVRNEVIMFNTLRIDVAEIKSEIKSQSGRLDRISEKILRGN